MNKRSVRYLSLHALPLRPLFQRRVWRWLIALLFAGVSLGAAAQAYPFKPLHVIVPFPPGGPTNVLGRIVAQGLSEALGQPAVVENKAGAGGKIGMEQAAKAPADGYTLAIVPLGNIAVNPTLFANLAFKASDLAPVAMLATVENVLVVNASLPARRVKELSSVLPHIKSGRLRALGVASLKRSPVLPDLKTIWPHWTWTLAPENQGLAAVIQAETVRWADVIRQKNIKPE